MPTALCLRVPTYRLPCWRVFANPSVFQATVPAPPFGQSRKDVFATAVKNPRRTLSSCSFLSLLFLDFLVHKPSWGGRENQVPCARAEEMAAVQDGALEPPWGGRGPRQGAAQRGVWSLSTMGGFCRRGVPQGVCAMACWSSIEVWRGSLQGTALRGLRGASVPDWGDSLAQAKRSSWMGRAFVPGAMEA